MSKKNLEIFYHSSLREIDGKISSILNINFTLTEFFFKKYEDI